MREGYGAAASRKLPEPLDAAHLPSSSSGAAQIPEADLIALNSPQESVSSPQESFIVRSRSAESLTGPSYAEKGKAKVTSALIGLQGGWLNEPSALATDGEKAAADLDLLQRTFAAWRSVSAAQHARRIRGNPGEVPPHESASLQMPACQHYAGPLSFLPLRSPTALALLCRFCELKCNCMRVHILKRCWIVWWWRCHYEGSPSVQWVLRNLACADAGRNAPPQVFLGIDNSRARGRPEQPLAKLTFFASYWIDNRTGMDLVFQDHAAAAPNPLLLGARMPGAFAQVLVPGDHS